MATLNKSNINTVLPAFMATVEQLGLKSMKVNKPHVVSPVFYAGPKAAVYFTRRNGEKLTLNLMYNGRIIRQVTGELTDAKVAHKLERWGRRAALQN